MTSNLADLSRFGLPAVFAGTLLEGEGVLIAASILAAQGILSPIATCLTAALGAWSGHLIWFSLGRRFGRRLLPRFERLAEKTREVDRVVEAHPALAIFLLQYLYGVRMAGALGLGLTRLSWRRFALYEAVNCLLWAALFSALGYGLGTVAAPLLHGWIRWVWMGASVAVLLGLVHHLSAHSLGGARGGRDAPGRADERSRSTPPQ